MSHHTTNDYILEQCFIRFQAPHFGHSGKVHEKTFKATPETVTKTIQNFGGGHENERLWFHGDADALSYAGLFHQTARGFFAQARLNGDDVVASIILPSGVAKLQRVAPDPRHLSAADNASTSGMFGLHSRPGAVLEDADYAYITVERLRHSLLVWQEQNHGMDARHRMTQCATWVTRGDGVKKVAVFDSLFGKVEVPHGSKAYKEMEEREKKKKHH